MQGRDYNLGLAFFYSTIKQLLLSIYALFIVAGASAQQSWHIGDSYDVNGKKGVVFAISSGGQHGKILSLSQSSTITTWNQAISWINSMNYGWRLPSKDELVAIYKVKSILNETLTPEGLLINDWWYWSITPFNEDSTWLTYMGDGSSSFYYKTGEGFARAVADF